MQPFYATVGTGILFGLTMIMVSIALVMSVIVTNIYLRKDTPTRVPRCLRRLLLRDNDEDDDDVAAKMAAVARSALPPPPPPPQPTCNGKLKQTAGVVDGGSVWTVGGRVYGKVFRILTTTTNC